MTLCPSELTAVISGQWSVCNQNFKSQELQFSHQLKHKIIFHMFFAVTSSSITRLLQCTLIYMYLSNQWSMTPKKYLKKQWPRRANVYRTSNTWSMTLSGITNTFWSIIMDNSTEAFNSKLLLQLRLSFRFLTTVKHISETNKICTSQT